MELWEKSVFPYAHFCEEQDALNGALTSAVIILPEYIYDRANHVIGADEETVFYIPKDLEEDEIRELTSLERQLAEAMGKFRLKGE